MLNKNDSWTVAEAHQNWRIDKFLQIGLTGISRTKIQSWITQGCFLLNQKPVKKNAFIKTGDFISVCQLPAAETTRLEPEEIPLEILFEDEHLIILNKPVGLVVHPGNGIHSGTLANGLIHHFKSLSNSGDPWRPGIVHRLDKDTSGLMAVAKTDECHNSLAAQLADRSMGRTYFALVWGEMPDIQGTIDAPIGRHRHQREKMSVSPSGKEAITHYRVLCFFDFACLVQFKLETGRTHQIRVHSAHIQRPIMGDKTYGYKKNPPPIIPPINRTAAIKCARHFGTQALHAGQLQFSHPLTLKTMEFKTAPAGNFLSALAGLKSYLQKATSFATQCRAEYAWFNDFLT